LKAQFIVHDKGNLDYFLGMDIIRNRDAKTIFISQKKYAFGTLTTFDLQDCNPKLEPLPAGCKFDGFGEANSTLHWSIQGENW